MYTFWAINPLTPNDHYSGRTAPLTSKRCILYIYSTNIDTEYFKHGIYYPCFYLQNAVFFHNSNVFGSCIIHILYTGCAKIKKKNNSGAKRLSSCRLFGNWCYQFQQQLREKLPVFPHVFKFSGFWKYDPLCILLCCTTCVQNCVGRNCTGKNHVGCGITIVSVSGRHAPCRRLNPHPNSSTKCQRMYSFRTGSEVEVTTVSVPTNNPHYIIDDIGNKYCNLWRRILRIDPWLSFLRLTSHSSPWVHADTCAPWGPPLSSSEPHHRRATVFLLHEVTPWTAAPR